MLWGTTTEYYLKELTLWSDKPGVFHSSSTSACMVRKRPSGSYGSCRKIIFHKIISFAEDIYDKIIKIHFLALHDPWNNFCSFTYLFHRPEGLFVINTYSKTCTRRCKLIKMHILAQNLLFLPFFSGHSVPNLIKYHNMKVFLIRRRSYLLFL